MIDTYDNLSQLPVKTQQQQVDELTAWQNSLLEPDVYDQQNEIASQMLTPEEIAKKKNPKGLNENIEVARRGGKIAGNAREDLEKEIGESVVTSNNALNYEYVDEKEIEMK